ncbi:uncharacterized protein MEPE_02999 [Melanopsichium pennsylvanicum]|uniref:Uncharacterized protein n=1 Tax=Melanopsichium pennsylvanicum TaxID=63383 RepID=A0AAJ4XKN2_9BASI|nr:uncharacterized protein MEPE_02999 [Melanopsichium pennsylvanicum]
MSSFKISAYSLEGDITFQLAQYSFQYVDMGPRVYKDPRPLMGYRFSSAMMKARKLDAQHVWGYSSASVASGFISGNRASISRY